LLSGKNYFWYNDLIFSHRQDFKPGPNDGNMSTQHVATLLGATCCAHLATLLRRVGCLSLKMVKFEPTTPNMSQQGGQMRAKYCAQTMLRYVELNCGDRFAEALQTYMGVF